MSVERVRQRICIELAQAGIEPGEIGDAGGSCIHGGEHCLADRSRVIAMLMRQQLQADIEAMAEQAHQRHIDTVGRGAAHNPSDDHAPAEVLASISAVTFRILPRSGKIFFSWGAVLMGFSSRFFFLKRNTRSDAFLMRRSIFLPLSASCRMVS